MTSTMRNRRNADEKVATWANGFGVWHARITFPAPGYDATEMTEHAGRVRGKARRAIREEITSRGETGPGWVCRIEEAETEVGADGVTKSITYRETVRD